MTMVQERQLTDALISFVLNATDGKHTISQEEAMMLPSVLSFLATTRMPERNFRMFIDDVVINGTSQPNLHKTVRKFVKSKE